METSVAIIILCEVLFTLFAVWGFLHEQTLVALERRAVRMLRRSIRRRQRARAAAVHRRQNAEALYTPALAVKRGSSSSRAA